MVGFSVSQVFHEHDCHILTKGDARGHPPKSNMSYLKVNPFLEIGNKSADLSILRILEIIIERGIEEGVYW